MAELLDRLQQHEAKASRDKAILFGNLVAAVAGGDAKHESAVAQRLEELGKTADDLASAVQLYQRRQTLLAELRDAGDVSGRLAAIEVELAAIGEQLRLARADAEKKTQSLVSERNALMATKAQLDSVRRELRRTNNDPSIVSREKDLLGKQAALADRQKKAAHEVQLAEAAATSARLVMRDAKRALDNTRGVSGSILQQRQNDAEQAEKTLAKAETFAEQKRAESDDVNRELSAVRAALQNVTREKETAP